MITILLLALTMAGATTTCDTIEWSQDLSDCRHIRFIFVAPETVDQPRITITLFSNRLMGRGWQVRALMGKRLLP